MNQSNNKGTKRHLHIPGHGEKRLDPMKARLTAEEERTGIAIIIEEREQEEH